MTNAEFRKLLLDCMEDEDTPAEALRWVERNSHESPTNRVVADPGWELQRGDPWTLSKGPEVFTVTSGEVKTRIASPKIFQRLNTDQFAGRKERNALRRAIVDMPATLHNLRVSFELWAQSCRMEERERKAITDRIGPRDFNALANLVLQSTKKRPILFS